MDIGIAKNMNYNDRYHSINENYYNKLKKSKIIVTANLPNWEGDFRLWEALLLGNLVLCDNMILPHILKYPLIHKKHIVFYHHPCEVINLIHYYIEHEDERNQIGKEGREYVLKYHTFGNRLDEILENITFM
jgi:spore maturation protein CgeB